MRTKIFVAVFTLLFMCSCDYIKQSRQSRHNNDSQEAIKREPVAIVLEKDLIYDKHTLADEYTYGNTTRRFQWDRIKDSLQTYETLQRDVEDIKWATLQNYKNKNGIAPDVQDENLSDPKRPKDKFGVMRYQSIPLYGADNMKDPVRYGRDGSLVRFIKDSADFVKIHSIIYDGDWYIPRKYVTELETPRFDHAIFVDRTNQNIATLEKSGGKWLIRSMNPATTGLKNPPYQYETPLGVFVVQEHKPRMYYTGDGNSHIAGYAPYASRFTQGGYIHGVPLNNPDATEADYIEFSPTLGTTPRSHLCVRNATSHAEFVYNWAPPLKSVVVVIEDQP